MATLLVRVLFPNEVIEDVSVQGTDTPRTLALSGPPLKSPVVLLHKGRCLCPYTSLDAQGVTNGDLVVLHPLPSAKDHPKTSAASASDALARFERELENRDEVFKEILRLADAAFLPYETSPCGNSAYHQMWKDEEEEITTAHPATVPTTVAQRAEGISTQPLPACWTAERIKSRKKKRRETLA